MKDVVAVTCIGAGTILFCLGFINIQTYTLTGFAMVMIGIGLWGVGINILKP